MAAIWPSSTSIAVAVTIAATQVPDARRTPRAPSTTARTIAILACLLVPLAIVAAAANRLDAETVACVLPSRASIVPVAVASRLMAVLAAAGPYVCALAVFGAVLLAGRIAWRRHLPLLLFVAGTAIVGEPDQIAAAAMVIWMAAAVGLREIVRVCRSGFGGHLAAVLLVALVPLLQWQHWAARRAQPDASASRHGRMSVTDAIRVLEALPVGADLVREDAVVDLLTRAASRDRGRAEPDFITPEAVDVTRRLTGTPARRVFALPAGQKALEGLGFQLADTELPGLAEVHPGGRCRGVGTEWRQVDDLETAPAFSIVAAHADEAGPIVLYAGFDTRPDLGNANWPASARRGFYTSVYEMATMNGRSQFTIDRDADGLSVEAFAGDRPFVARLELWRTPTAPAALITTLGAPPHDVVARVTAPREPKRLTLCPVTPHDIRPLP
jgi:hypothetical protein